MINPLLTKGRILFVKNGCPFCKKWENFIYNLNSHIKINKRIQIIDCSNYSRYGIVDNPVIDIFEPYFDSYPTLFFEGEKKTGISSSIEAKSWLVTRLILEDDFIFQRDPKLLETLEKNALFNLDCRFFKGRLVCKEVENN